jgi:uncharacterized membrane protein
MNDAHFHLLVNHFPVVGTIFSTLILSYGLLYKNNIVKNTGLVLYIVTALFAVPAYLTGKGAVDILQSIGQKNDFFIQEHETMAANATWLCISIAILSFGILLNKNLKKNYLSALLKVVLIAGLFNSALMVITSNYGGMIRHSEIRNY